jgi:hypothetical protein
MGEALPTLTSVFNYDAANSYVNNYTADSATWGSGNALYRAPLVIGNKDSSSAYNYPSTVTLENVSISSVVNIYKYTQNANGTYTYGELEATYTGDTALNKTAIYTLGSNKNVVTLTVKGTNTFVGNVVKGNSSVTISGLTEYVDKTVTA